MMIQKAKKDSKNDNNIDKNKNKSEINSNSGAGKDAENVRILTQPISAENLITAQRRSVWPYVCLVVSIFLLFVVGYFSWFFQNQNEVLRNRFDKIQQQINLEFKDRLASITSFDKKIQNSMVNINSISKLVKVNQDQINSLKTQNSDIKKLVVFNEQTIQKQRDMLLNPSDALSKIKHNADNIMLSSFIKNMQQALVLGKVVLAKNLWLDNYKWLDFRFSEAKTNISKINSKILALNNPNQDILLKEINVLLGMRDKLSLLSVGNAKAKFGNNKSINKSINNKDASWWEHKKQLSEKYLAEFWQNIKSSFVIADAKDQPAIITQADQIDSYRVISQYLMQMQWGIFNGDVMQFDNAQMALGVFVQKHIVKNTAQIKWLQKLNSLKLPDQKAKVQDIINELVVLENKF